jgi:ElaB/YqjD/DUF883 family membrane-anchored ribosome-binding protein
MADIPEVASTTRRPTRRAAASRAAAATHSIAAAREQDNLEDQIARLQTEMKAIGNSLARLTDEKIGEARSTARAQYRSAITSGRSVVDELSEQVNSYEGQLVDAIRERPLTAVAGAVGVGFLIALLSRR